VPPRSKLGNAIGYASLNWQYLNVFLTDGRAAIDNNWMENGIRPVAIGRKNWLFCDTVAGAHACATFYSLTTTARTNGLNVMSYLEMLLDELPLALQANPEADLSQFLPWNYKKTLA
jgi:hypothetical protein